MKNIENQELEFEYVGFWTRVGATIIDILIIVPIILIITLIFRDTMLQSQKQAIWLRIMINIIVIIFRIFFTVTYGGTPGKLVTKIRIINERGNYIAVDKALLRLLPNLFYTIISASVRHSMGNDVSPGLGLLLDLILILDVSLIAFNEKKKALHDYLAKSYVVTKESLLKTQGCKRGIDEYID